MKQILTSIITVLIAFSVFGETPADSVKVYFLVGSRVFDPSLGNNRTAMDGFIERIKVAKAQDNIKQLVVSGYASPEGASDANQRLSRLRCDEIADYIALHTGIDAGDIQTYADGVAWAELRSIVADTPEVPDRQKVLHILDNTPLWIYNSEKTKIVDGKKKQLMELAGGRVWNWLMDNIFPELRNAVAVVLYLKREAADEALAQAVVPYDNIPAPVKNATLSISNETITTETTGNETDTVDTIINETKMTETELSGVDVTDVSISYKDQNVTEASSSFADMKVSGTVSKPFYMSVKTNMLYDAAFTPNIGAEFYIGKDFSVYGEWMHAWWSNDISHHYWRIYGGDIGARWWFGKKAKAKPLTGHHVGVYGGIVTFDFEFGETGYMGGKPGGTLFDRWLLYAGVEYGYSLPVAKRLNIDFSIGLGYFSGNYIKYFPFDNTYYSQKEYRIRFFGPTKAEISLVWLIGHGNTNSRKGGDR